MALITIHGIKLAAGGYIENAVFESITTPLDQTAIDASDLGRQYFDVTNNCLMAIVSDGASGKKSIKIGEVEYDPDTTSVILSGATSYMEADQALATYVLGIKTDVDAIKADAGALTFVYASTTAADTHNINHDLDADFVDVAVWVKDPVTELYAVDIVSIVEVDKDNIQVKLSDDYDIKVVIRRADAN